MSGSHKNIPCKRNPYDDIINLPHHISRTRPQMPMANRAAQFAPFAALTGYEAAVNETARITEEKILPGEDARAALDETLRIITCQPPETVRAVVTYFLPDTQKTGGAYVTVTGFVKKAEPYKRLLIMEGGAQIPLADILNIEITD